MWASLRLVHTARDRTVTGGKRVAEGGDPANPIFSTRARGR